MSLHHLDSKNDENQRIVIQHQPHSLRLANLQMNHTQLEDVASPSIGWPNANGQTVADNWPDDHSCDSNFSKYKSFPQTSSAGDDQLEFHVSQAVFSSRRYFEKP